MRETVGEAYKRLSRELGETDARLILCAALGWDWNRLLRDGGEPLLFAANTVAGYVRRRRAGEPLQYILGRWEFMGLPIVTDRRALIPRQDTECVAEAALALKPETALDMCCGTGCIGIALAKLGGTRVTFADISADCLDLARENCELNGVPGEFVRGDLFENIAGRYDVIVTNPPYLTAADMKKLQPEVACEPAAALFGGDDGLDFIRRIAAGAPGRLNPGGAVIMETGSLQGATAAALTGGRIIKDANGLDRAVIFGGNDA